MDQKNNSLVIPGSILLAGVLIAGSIYYTNKPNGAVLGAGVIKANQPQEVKVSPVLSTDHLLGNPNAKVVMIEYSDTDCPYCQVFMPTMKRIMDEYGKKGDVAWVYRHFTVHPKAPYEAQATECAAELGGNDAFWKYLDLLFSKKDFTQNPYKGLDPTELPPLASSIGLNQTAFTKCLNSKKYESKVQGQYQEAIQSGGEGTPHTILASGDKKIFIKGAQPYENVKASIEQLLKQ